MANYKVIWSPECEEDYTNILRYLNDVWGVNAALNFMEKTERTLEYLAQTPFMFEAVNRQQIRRVVINKATSLYYYVSNDQVELLYFWNNRRNPADNPFSQT